MKTAKMSLKNIQKRLSREEMKKIMAGSDGCYVWHSDNCPPPKVIRVFEGIPFCCPA